MASLDIVADARRTRLQQAQEQPSLVLLVVFFGYLVTMVYFAVYGTSRILLMLLSFYTWFIGIIMYLMLAMSDPFEGAIAIDAMPFTRVLQEMSQRVMN